MESCGEFAGKGKWKRGSEYRYSQVNTLATILIYNELKTGFPLPHTSDIGLCQSHLWNSATEPSVKRSGPKSCLGTTHQEVLSALNRGAR